MGKVEHDSGSEDDDNATEKTFTKGPWSQAEDDLLLAYIEKHGDGNWNNVQRNSTLSRCGKSCRLRWVNHLRPNLKKGAFTDEEEKRVVELHAEIGNKWARMSAELPGRTDNEIKNFWNTRLKRLQRLGLPVYPDEVREKAMNAAAQSGLNPDPLNAHSSQDSMEVDNDEFPSLDFKLLPTNPSPSYFQSMVPNFTPITGSFLREKPCFIQPNMYNSTAFPSGTAYLRQMPCVFQPYMYNSTASPSGTAYLRQMPCVFQPNMYNSIASPSGTASPFTGGGSMDEQSLPLENYLSVESTLEQHIHLPENATYPSPSGTAYPFTGEESMDEQSLPLENYPLVESNLEQGSMDEQSLPLGNYPFVECNLARGSMDEQSPPLENYPFSPFEPLIHGTEEFELTSLQCFDFYEAAGTSEAQQYDPIAELESDNTLVQPPLTDQTPSNVYESSLYDGLLESIVYRSSGERRATETDSESSLDMSSLIGHTELPPSTSNTTGQLEESVPVGAIG